jgi:hypothetical protein
VAALRSAPLFLDTINAREWEDSGKLAEFTGATGIDPRRDVDKVTVAKLGPREGFAIVQGRIDKFKVEQFLKDKGKQSEVYLGQTLYHDGDGALILLDNVVILGHVDAVKKAMDQAQLPGSLPLRSDLTAAIQTIEAGNQVWAAGDFSINDLNGLGVRGPGPALELLKSLESGTYQMRVDTGITARGAGKFADAESAKNVSDLARGALAVAKLQVAKQPELLHLLDGVQVSNTGATLTVNIAESGDLLKALKDFRPTVERRLR